MLGLLTSGATHAVGGLPSSPSSCRVLFAEGNPPDVRAEIILGKITMRSIAACPLQTFLFPKYKDTLSLVIRFVFMVKSALQKYRCRKANS